MKCGRIETHRKILKLNKRFLGSVFLDAETIIDAMEYIEPKDFYRRGHQIILRQ